MSNHRRGATAPSVSARHRLVIGALLAGVTLLPAQAHAAPLTLSFGAYTRDTPSVMYSSLAPALRALEAHMSDELGAAVTVELRIYKTYSEANDALVAGAIDFVHFGPASYVLAKRRNPDIRIIAADKKTSEGVIFTRADSGVTTIAAAAGKRVAFGDEASTIGRYYFQAALADAGVKRQDLAAISYLDSHDHVAAAVNVGDYDVGAVKLSTFKRHDKGDALRVLHTLQVPGKVWIARADLEERVFLAICRGLVGLDDKDALRGLDSAGFVVTHDKHYEELRRHMSLAEAFGEDRR